MGDTAVMARGVSDYAPLDEDDLALIDALHVSPRATADQLGRVLGLSAVTVARRWRRLVDGGQAWVSVVPGPRMSFMGAVFEGRCTPGDLHDCARGLAAIPSVASVGLLSGDMNIYALVAADEPARMWRLLADTLPSVDGLTAMRSSVVSAMFSGWNWRLGAISSAQAAAVRAQVEDDPAPRVLDDFDRALFLALQSDGRMSYRDLATLTGRSEQMVNRRISAMTRADLIRFRTDFVRPQAGWRVQVLMRLQIPPADLNQVGSVAAGWPESRVCAAVTGDANLILTVLLHQVSDLHDVIRRLHVTCPDVNVVDHNVVLRSAKSWGRLLDADGHSTSVVPVDLWS
jgi:DNA-binding Lrp family transcriptional regulator